MKRFSLFLCLCLILCLLPLPVSAQTQAEAYDELSTDTLREAYRILEEGIAGMAPVITFPEELGLHYSDLPDITRAVCLDHPEYFWFLESGYYEYESKDGRYEVSNLTPTYFLDNQPVSAGSQALADAMIAFRSKVDEIITGIPVNCTSDYDIALYLHDYLAQHVTYTLEGDHDSAYAALIHGKAACYGYSKAYQYLLSQAGVRSRIIVGNSLEADGSLFGHAWNQVWIDGECYYTDVTWDDMEEVTFHQFFLVSLEEISRDHIADDMFTLPECSHSMDYFEISGGKGTAAFTSRTKGDDAAEYFRLTEHTGNQAVLMCEVRFDGDCVAWLDKNAEDLADALGLSRRAELSYYYFTDVYYLILTDPAYSAPAKAAKSIDLSLTEVSLTGIGAQAQLDVQITPFEAGLLNPVFTSDNEAVAVVRSSGTVKAVSPGTATITVTSADGRVSAACTVTVTAGEAHVHTLRLIGASDPTCTLDGNDPYYLCSGCFHRFADEDGALELTDVEEYARMATGHTDTNWHGKGKNHVLVCSCGTQIPNTTGNHSDSDGDNHCDVCGSVFMNATLSTPVSDPIPEVLPDAWKALLIWVGILAGAAVLFLVIKRRR